MWKRTGPLTTSAPRTRTLPGHDYEYDEAHDVQAGPLVNLLRHMCRSPPPKVNIGAGGDYGYDEAHDFGAS